MALQPSDYGLLPMPVNGCPSTSSRRSTSSCENSRLTEYLACYLTWTVNPIDSSCRSHAAHQCKHVLEWVGLFGKIVDFVKANAAKPEDTQTSPRYTELL